MEDTGMAIALDEAIAALESGDDLAAVLARYSSRAAALTPLLDVATRLRRTSDEAVATPLPFLEDLGRRLRADPGAR